ncbi:DNA repair ATPase [Allorhodopirellula heiligendammensis]|uniref:ATPase involved in DNA repair n=1 Tax=Allorhodopirellula heiligendammensis TaxID=2714739 RepID=A0A5C6C371_9BACT|nr:DNA repair ATPase [Allorhodopirellula heiligendammensis]TWU18061.1 ATPase involved in DNA repair [Allorhodopirellula heiligendammensis]
MTDTQLAGGTYEILRNRLNESAGDLRTRLGELNADRSEVFGNIETRLIATQRITTEHNCIARDIVSIGDHFVFGYNVQFGLKTEIHLPDVFAIYRMEAHEFHRESLDLISDPKFVRDFEELYRFYKGTTFLRFFVAGPILHMVFQVGRTASDIKSFKWRVVNGDVEYIDNRSDHEVRRPDQHAFAWQRATRDMHRYGDHPHISIEDRVFVETVGGDLTIKVENNTASGEGIYAEPVDNPDQKLDDAETYYAIVGNLVLLKIKPYQENAFRYIVFSGKVNQAVRLDEIQHACVMLPGDQGLIFPGGYYLQSGEFKRFDHGLADMRYERTIASPNGEDYLYLFSNLDQGTYVQLRYNQIRQNVDTPLVCHGQTFFEAGEMVCFKGNQSPQKHHPIQIWQTPFVSDDFLPPHQTDSMLFKIGNKELVRGMAECSEVLQLIEKDDSYDSLYQDLVKKSGDILDSYFWIDKPETHHLDKPLGEIRGTATAAIEEFEKVTRVRSETKRRTEQVQTAIEQTLKEVERSRFESINDFVAALTRLREHRGHAITLGDLKFADVPLAENLETQLTDATTRLSRRCVEFLLTSDSLAPYHSAIAAADAKVAAVDSVSNAKELESEIDTAASELELLTETVSNLRIDDATQRTDIIDAIGDVFAMVNRVRSALKNRRRDLVGIEGRAEFASQMKLLQQSTAGYLDVCDTPARCDEYMTKVMVSLEELEGRFAEFDEFIETLAERREEIYTAFESRKVSLLEKRNQRAESLASAADRILKGIASRVTAMESSDAIASYFAGDLMVAKIRSLIDELDELGDAVRVGDLQGRLKVIREDATRGLKDRQDLFEDGGDVIRLGQRKFAVNTQPLDLTTVYRGGDLCLHLTGTQFFEPMSDPRLDAARELWDQPLISENRDVYRAEFLAMDLFESIHSDLAEHHADGNTVEQAWVSQQMNGRFDEGYAKGVHDVDATAILNALLKIDERLGLLRYEPTLRACSQFWWHLLLDDRRRGEMSDWIAGFAKLARAYPNAKPAVQFRERLSELALADADTWRPLFGPHLSADRIAAYLFDELLVSPSKTTASGRAADLLKEFQDALPASDRKKWLVAGLQNNAEDPTRLFVLTRNWVDAFLTKQQAGTDQDVDPASGYRDEIAWLVMSEVVGQTDSKSMAMQPRSDVGEAESIVSRLNIIDVPVAVAIGSLVGSHDRISNGEMTLHFHDFLHRLRTYRESVVPRFRALHVAKAELVKNARDSMRLDEFKPKVLSSFVRNQLLDDVYLPLIGDNLAKQMGVAGADKRTDRMGLLLLISPPGYGKTTLMEYVANRLGLVFMKINGPAIGHAVTSLDPAEAPNAAAREEVERLNLALEMGDNVMLYLDDIQHTHPELLQKFISLCDATRKIEGVRHGKTRTYDLRGRRVAVVMAGNPYTESGDRFQVPDMLSNRADVYNLGEIIGDKADAFEMSYIENCLSSNTTLAPLSAAPPVDARRIAMAARRDSIEGIELESNFSLDQVRDMFEVTRKLLRVRDVVLRVNRAYIRSAAQADSYRTEPPFKLQGSYRNMNRIAERVAPVMNDAELQTLIVSNYEQDAQTLTTDNEANVLKFKELMGIMTPAETQRWDAIKYAFVESVRMAGMDSEDQVGQVLRQLASMRDGLESIRQVLAKAIAMTDHSGEERMDARVDTLRQSLLAIGESLSHQLHATGGKIEDLARQNAAAPVEQKVLVQHKVPRVMAELIKGQFHLMQEWMRPLLAESIDNGRDLDRLLNQLDQMMQTYQDVEDVLDPPAGDVD